MSQFNDRNLVKKIENLQQEISDSPSLWNTDNSEEEQQDIARVKQKWQRKQNRNFKKVQKKRQENKSIKKIFLILIGLTTIPVVLTVGTYLWQTVNVQIVESSTRENKAESDVTENSTFLDKIRELKKTAKKDDSPKSESDELVTTPCPSETASECKTVDEPTTIADELVESIDSIDSYYEELDKTIRLSNGEDVSLGDEE